VLAAGAPVNEGRCAPPLLAALAHEHRLQPRDPLAHARPVYGALSGALLSSAGEARGCRRRLSICAGIRRRCRPPAIRVLDLSRVLAGPWAAQNLADLGAEVIKIERPGAGDDTRGWGPPWLTDGAGKDSTESAYFQAVNRNKKSVTLDISKPEGQKIARELAMKSQVLIENYKVGTLKRYGLDFDSLKTDNPSLIYCSVTGFGQDGPYAPRPGYDFIFQGMGGLMSITGERDGQPGAGPQKVGIAITDVLTGMYASVAILAAITHRERTGQGQYIDAALLDTIVAFNANQIASYFASGKIPGRWGNAHAQVVPYEVFPTADGTLSWPSATTASSRASARPPAALNSPRKLDSRPIRRASCTAAN
jgi:crotonobetainyl-CoA:carnitine CoA-transferase CaiB-like acyl-CoA transferase